MNADELQQYWGLLVAAGLLAVVAGFVVAALYRRSARGQLRATLKTLRKARRDHAATKRRLEAAERRLESREARASSVKPRVLTEAKEGVGDAQALVKIAGDRVLVAANHVRRVIYEEFPPTRQEALRQRHLPDDAPDSRPFTF